jgi:hypothetical protein
MISHHNERAEIMAKLEWAGREREVRCTDAELAEVLAMGDAVITGYWLGFVNEIGHDMAFEWAKEYANELAEM